MSPAARDELYLLAGEYVLGVLPAVDAREFESRLERERELRAAVDYWERRLIGFAGAVPRIEPGPALWVRIAASTAARPAVAAGERARFRVGLWQRVAVWRALSGAAFATALVALFVAFGQPRPAASYTVVLQATADRSVGWIAQAEQSGDLLFVPVARTAVPPGRVLQLWARADDPRGPVSLGLLPDAGRFRVPVGDGPPRGPGELFAISLEPAGGSPTGQPTGPVLFAGRAIALE